MKKYNIKDIDRSYLKRKKNEILVFDIYVNQINEIKILSENEKSIFYFDEKNKVLQLLPPYIRKKSKSRYDYLQIYQNIRNYMINKICEKEKEKVEKNFKEAKNEEKKVFSSKKILNPKSIEKYVENKEKDKEKIEKIIINQKNNSVINNDKFKEIVKQQIPISHNDVQKIEIDGDGNCLYRCLSFFLLGNDKFYENIKNEIINWIEENMETFKEFFGDDDINNISKEKLAEDEYNYIKKKDSWGGFHTIEIACIIFNISI